MKNLFKKAYSLIDRNKCITTQCDYIADILYSEYSNIPKDILKYFFIRHSNQADEILKSINPLIAHTIHVKVLNFNNKQLMDDRIIQNANFTNYPPAYANDENRDMTEKEQEKWNEIDEQISNLKDCVAYIENAMECLGDYID